MLKEKAITLLKIHPEEIRLVAWVAALFLLVQAGQGFGDTAAFTLFVSHNVNRLPYLYVPLGVIVFLVSLGFSASLGRFQNANVVLGFLSGFVILLFVEWVMIVVFSISITQYFWLTVNGMGIVLGTVIWTVAGAVCDARQAKRLFPFFTSVAILGSVIGSSLSGILAKWLGPSNLIIVFALVLGGALFLLRNITRTYFKPELPSVAKFDLVDDLRAGFDFVRGSGLFRLVAITSILYSVLFFTVDFPFSQFVSDKFVHDEVQVANFKGLFTSAMTLVTFFVSLIIANRLYAKLGIVNSILIMPLTYVIGFAAFFIFFRFEIAVSVRFIQQIILGGVMGTAWNALFNVVPLERRGQVLAFVNGVPAQIGVLLSGLLLIVGSRIFSTTHQILLMGAVVALICFYFTWKMRAEYGNALVSALQAGRIEVFSGEDEAFAGYQDDPAALQATFKALHDSRPSVRRLATEILAGMRTPMAIPDLVERLSDVDASVRAAAMRALTDLGAKGTFSQIVLGLDDVDDTVREEALASIPKLEIASSPELILSLERLLNDSNIRISSRAAVVLMYLGESDKASSLLARLLQDNDARSRETALSAYQAIAGQTDAVIPFNVDLILEALNDLIPEVRRGALRVAAHFKDAAVIEAMSHHLSDVDVAVRRTASESLKQAWPESRSVILQILSQKDDVAATPALDAIPLGDVEVVIPLRAYIQNQASEIHYWRTLIDSLPPKGRMVKLLVELLRYRIALIEERLVKAVGLFGNPRAMDLVQKGLVAGNVSARAAALEALETLGDKRIITEVLPILDHSGVFRSDEDQHIPGPELAMIFLKNEDRWLRALGPHVVVDLELDDLIPEIRKMFLDPDALVKEAAQNAMTRLGGYVTMRTLKTLTTLDRVLLLREIPIFMGLSPDDLERIAEIAQEQLYLDQAILCREGEPGSTLFIIASGTVDVLKKTGEADKVLVSRTRGDFVGEMAILESAPRSATLRAHGGVRTLVIDGDAFDAILLDRPQVAVSVLRRMSTRVRELNEKIGAAG